MGMIRSRAVGGIAAQGSQAMVSFVLQIVAVRALDLSGFGRFTVLYGFIVLATAIASGIVGDPATVLDRHDRRIRAGLQFWWLLTGLCGGLAVLVGSVLSGQLELRTALCFGLAVALFLWEDTLRRLLMANLVFWRIVAVDLSGLAGTVLVVVVLPTIDLAGLLLALAAGQLIAAVVALLLIPRHDRYLVAPRAPAIRTVIGYGSWRTVYRSLRPATSSLVMVGCGAVVGLAAVGDLGITRTYMAPAALIVSGVSSVLFADYASRRDQPLRSLLATADRNALVLLVTIAGLGLVAAAAFGTLGPLLLGRPDLPPVVLVLGWAGFSAAIAMGSPYSELASVRGRHTRVVPFRVAEAVLSVAAAMLVAALTGETTWVPAAMAAVTLVSSLAIRRFVIAPMLDRPVD